MHLCWRSADIRQFGWWGAVPDVVLVRVAPMDSEAWPVQQQGRKWRYKAAKHPALVELFRRAKTESFLWSNGQPFFDRVFANDPTVLDGAIQTRGEWPNGVPIGLRQHGIPLSELTPSWDRLVIRTRIRNSSEDWRQTVLAERWTAAGRYMQILGMPANGAKEAIIEGEFWDGVPDAGGHRLWRGVVRRITLGREANNILSAVDASELAPTSIAFASTTLIVPRSGDPVLGLFPVGYHLGSSDIDWALGARLEVLHKNQVVATGEMLYPMTNKNVMASLMSGPTFPLVWKEPPPEPSSFAAIDWQLRVIGDPNITLRDIERDAYWPGKVTVPIEKCEDAEHAILWQLK